MSSRCNLHCQWCVGKALQAPKPVRGVPNLRRGDSPALDPFAGQTVLKSPKRRFCTGSGELSH